MALDLSGFNSGVQNYEGLYKLGDDVSQNKELDLRKQEMDFRNNQFAQNEADKESARKNATASYLKGFLNPAQFATGTIYDPIIDNGVRGIMGKAMGYASQGLDAPTISSLINQDVAKLSQTSQNLKQINAQAVNMKKLMSAQKGFDAAKFDDEFKNNTYFTTDDKGNKVLKDISQLDPQQDYADDVLRNGNVWNNQTVDDFLKNTKPLVYSSSIKDRNSSGRLTETKGDISSAPFMIPQTDEQGAIVKQDGRPVFVPKYDIATNEDAALIHNFNGDPKSAAPVHIVTDDIWDHTPNNVKAYVLQEVRQHLKGNPNIKMTDPQAEILGKAILYDELKNSPYNGGTFKQAATTMQPLPPRISVNIKNGSDIPTIDAYKNIQEEADSHKDRTMTSAVTGKPIPGAFQVNTLDDQTQGVVMQKAEKAFGKKVDVSQVYLRQFPDGIYIVDNDTDEPKVRLTKTGTNLSANSSLGMKSKQQSVKESSKGLSDEDFKNFLKKNGLTK